MTTPARIALVSCMRNEGIFVPEWLAYHAGLGFDRIVAYLTGTDDGQPKDADWAAAETGIAAETIRALARRMAAGRTMISVAAGVQRTDYGEQPMWMAVTLAAIER